MPNAPTTDIVKTNCYKYLKVYIQSNQISERTNVKNTIHPPDLKLNALKLIKSKLFQLDNAGCSKSLMHNLKSHDLQV